VAAPRPNGEDSKSAQEIYADMKKALRSVSSIAVHTQGTRQDTTTFTEDDTFGIDVTHSVQSSGPTVIETLITKRRAYVRGGDFGSNWGLASTDPTCLMPGTRFAFDFNHVGTLTKGSASTVGGKRVIEVDDDGKAPGANALHVFVALDGPPLPVQIVQNGAPTPGGTPCAITAAIANPPVSSTITWRTNVAVRAIPAPTKPVDRREVILAAALYNPAAKSLNDGINSSTNQASSDFGQSLTSASDALRSFVTAFSAIKFPAALQSEAQALLTAANNTQTAASAAAAALAQGDTNPANTFIQNLTTFDNTTTAFEAQLKQAL
jgi:hypothetical protein